MKVIPISSPVDYFQFTTTINQQVWTFIFRWNSVGGLFHVDVNLNRVPYIKSIAVLGGVFVLDNFTQGYNFLLLGDVSVVSDLGTKMKLYQITTTEAINLGLIKNAGD